jgi:endonuclease/exonuclease/phosphatase family metal-dependent hydrolase
MRLLSLFLFLCFFSGEMLAQAPLNVMTFNIRYNNITDEENSWPFRKDNAAMQIRFYEASLVGVQEALHDQLEDLKERLPGFNVIGVGRDDGKNAGEYSAILYNKERLKVLDSATFWLSETPAIVGSIGWDAAITRVVTWAKFRDKKTRKVFYHFNTHFDHKGIIARRESARLLIKAVDSIAGKTNAIITGDFNASPVDEPIKVITDITNPLHFTNTLGLSILPHYGPKGTFNEFGPKEISNNPIDYIFIKGKFEVLKHATISESWQGRFSSDHFPVFASLIIL